MPKQMGMAVDTLVQDLSLYDKNMLAYSITVRCDHLITLYENIYQNLHIVDKTINYLIKEQPVWSFSQKCPIP